MNQTNLSKNLASFQTGGKATLDGSSLWRLLVLVLMSLVLSNLSVSFLALIFVAPVPLVIAQLVYGRKVTISLAVFLMALLSSVTLSLEPELVYILFAFAVTIILGVATTYAIEKQVNPYRLIMVLGTSVTASIWALFAYAIMVMKLDLKQLILEKLQEAQGILQSSQQLELEELVVQLYASLPIIFTFIPFIGAWLFVLLIFNNKANWTRYQRYPYGMTELMSFKTPFWFVYALVFGLGLGLIGNHYKIDELWTVAMVIINFLGAFYFFQGFGIFWESMNRFQIKGFIRTLLIFVVVIWAMMWVALIGLFDTWLDFRKILERRTEGE